MTGKSHLIAAGILGASVSAKLDLHPAHILICMAGGLFPDTDQRGTYMGRFIPMWLFVGPHRRNITHSLLGALAFSIPWSLPSYVFLFFLGYLSHLILDLFNYTGIALWWPKKHMVTLADVKVGGLGELLITFLFYMMVIAIMSYW